MFQRILNRSAAIALLPVLVGTAAGDLLLSTDFTGRTVSGNTANNISWTTNGFADPGSLTAVDVNSTGSLAGLFNTANAQGHFAPDLNTGNEGPWSVSIPLTVLPDNQVTLDDVVLDWQHFNNSGNFQGPSRSVDWTATVTGSSSGVLDSVTNPNVSGTSGLEAIEFAPSLILSDDENFFLEILAEGSNSTGNNTGLDGITLNGTVEQIEQVVPEPASIAIWSLLGLALCGFGYGCVRRNK